MITRKCAAAALALLLVPCAVPVADAHGQDTLSVAARLVMRQPAGIVLRVNAGGEQVTGVLERVTADSVHLAGPARTLALRAVTDAWLQRRSTRSGAKVGLIAGATTGAATFGLGAALLSVLEDDLGAGDIAVATLIGGAAGSAAGYLLGALFGASVPRWEPLTESSAPATIVARDPRRHAGLSSMNVTPVAARAAERSDGVGVGVGVSYLSQLSRHFALGAEFGVYDVSATPTSFTVPCEPPEMVCTVSGEPVGRSWNAGGLARVGLGAERLLEPYALLGLGVTDFGTRDITLGGYSAGAGVRYRPGGGRFALSGEGRWYSNLTISGEDSELGFYTFGLALTLLR